MDKPRRPIRGLGEIALRVADLDAMHRFYQGVVGLRLLKRFDRAAFFRIAAGHGGHTQILALFDRSTDPDFKGLDPERSTVDHIAFEIDASDYDAEKSRLEALGHAVVTAEHRWVHWRSLYITDPEGNTVEWVCFDELIR